MIYGYITGHSELLRNDFDTYTKEEMDLHAKIEKMIDVSKPLLPQVRKMNNKEFMAFCKRPRYMEDTDGVILFEHNDESSKNCYRTNV